MTRSTSVNGIVPRGPRISMPALAIAASSRPNRSVVAATARSRSASDVTSASIASVWSPSSADRLWIPAPSMSTSETRWPASTNRRAVCEPIPPAAPVSRTTLRGIAFAMSGILLAGRVLGGRDHRLPRGRSTQLAEPSPPSGRGGTGAGRAGLGIDRVGVDRFPTSGPLYRHGDASITGKERSPASGGTFMSSHLDPSRPRPQSRIRPISLADNAFCVFQRSMRANDSC